MLLLLLLLPGHSPGVMNKVGQYMAGLARSAFCKKQCLPAHELFIAAGLNKNHAKIAIVLHD
jgi:hypothetical protein